MKCVLVNAPCGKADSLRDLWYLPLGLVSIAQTLQYHRHDATVVDGLVLGLEETLEQCVGDIVGVGSNCASVSEMEAIVKRAKGEGAFTVLGGHAVSATPELFLQNTDVDAVIVGDGEWAMTDLAKALSSGGKLSGVPNLVYRSGRSVIHTQRQERPLAELPMMRRDVGSLDPETYIQRYAKTSSDPVRLGLRPTNVVTRRGCPRRTLGGGCSFCARMGRKVRARTPAQAWEEYRYLVEELNANYLYEDSDSWIDVGWLDRLADIWDQNGGLAAQFRVYGDVRDVTPESVDLLRRLSVDTVLLGIESGDRNVLLQNGKDFATHDVERACALLARAGVRVADAYVLGLAGESWESVDKTIAMSRSVHSICDIAATYWNIMLPLPGAPSWDMLLQESPVASQFSQTYRLNADLVRREFLTYCTNLGPSALEELEALRAELCRRCAMPVGEYIR